MSEIQRVVPEVRPEKRYPHIDAAIKNAIRDAQFQKFREERKNNGGVAERSNAPVSKTGEDASSP
jgi:hypothetical protein